MEYFFTPPSLIASDTLIIEGEEYTHLTYVMRRRVGDEIRVVDGAGGAYDAIIEQRVGRKALCRITGHHRLLNEPRANVTVAVALLKNPAKFDFIVEKTTELGVNAIVPLVTERTIVRQAKKERWQKLAIAAMKQSGRCVAPRIHAATTVGDFLATSCGDAFKIIAHEKAVARVSGNVFGRDDYVIAIGPEGGFTDDEVGRAGERGFLPVNLGPRRLRTETAVIVAAALVLAEFIPS